MPAGAATDVDLFNRANKCNSGVFNMGDVLEVFAGAVMHTTDNPVSYWEVDTAVTGALWTGVAHNTAGNVSNCGNDSTSLGCKQGELNCSGLADFGASGPVATVVNGSGWWADQLTLPWTMFTNSVSVWSVRLTPYMVYIVYLLVQ